MLPRSQKELVTHLQRSNLLKTPLLVECFHLVDRKFFNPHPSPYEDHPYPIGAEATISAPNVHAIGIEAVVSNLIGTIPSQTNPQQQIIPTRTILDVASGSGFQTALFGTVIKKLRSNQQYQLEQNKSKVYGIDIHQGLVDQSIINCNAYDPSLIQDGIIELKRADAFRPEQKFPGAPFDIIHSGVACNFLPLSLLTQLKKGGTMVAPIAVNANNEQYFFQLHRKDIDYTTTPYANKITNDDEFFLYGKQLQENGSGQDRNTFLDTFFTHETLFGCTYISVHSDDTVPTHVPAYKVQHQ